MSHRESYVACVDLVHTLELQKAKIERHIEAEADIVLRSRSVLPGTTGKFLADGMKAKDDRIVDLDRRIDRAVARATMYGLGALYELGHR